MASEVLRGDALATLRALPAGIADCCVTSPPYWGLRRYGTKPQVWDSEWKCEHAWAAPRVVTKGGIGQNRGLRNPPDSAVRRARDVEAQRLDQGRVCRRCGAWRGELGLEPTPERYVSHLVQVFREVRRVLKPGSTLWLVLGDTYYAAGGACESPGGGVHEGHPRGHPPSRLPNAAGLKPKDLVGIPWRVAFALQADGWWLRSACVWAKTNGLPSSVRDRFACKHEHVFLLANAARYHFDLDAIREPFAPGTYRRVEQENVLRQPGGPKQREFWRAVPAGRRQERSPREIVKSVARSLARAKTAAGDGGPGARLPPEPGEPRAFHPLGKNPGDVWVLPTAPSRLPHFATFPPALVRRCILAGCPPGGLVLDPFVGVGTTLLVAQQLGRSGLGIDLHPRYVAIARKRLAEGGRRAA